MAFFDRLGINARGSNGELKSYRNAFKSFGIACISHATFLLWFVILILPSDPDVNAVYPQACLSGLHAGVFGLSDQRLSASAEEGSHPEVDQGHHCALDLPISGLDVPLLSSACQVEKVPLAWRHESGKIIC